MYDNLYIKIYLNSELEFDELFQHIICKVSGRKEYRRTIKTDWGEIDLCRNSDFNLQKLEDDPEDFVFWKYYLDIEPEKGIDQYCYINEISELLEGLKSENMKAVASCDFEEDL